MSDEARMYQMEREFLERHKDADLLIVHEKSGKVHEAVYHSMWKKMHDEQARFFQLVAERESQLKQAE